MVQFAENRDLGGSLARGGFLREGEEYLDRSYVDLFEGEVLLALDVLHPVAHA
jgi:hypothetical protein